MHELFNALSEVCAIDDIHRHQSSTLSHKLYSKQFNVAFTLLQRDSQQQQQKLTEKAEKKQKRKETGKKTEKDTPRAQDTSKESLFGAAPWCPP